MKIFSMPTGVVVSLVLISSQALAQIPVTDGAAIKTSVQQQVETMAKWKLQYDQMVNQIDQMKQEYQSITGVRGLGDVLNNPALRDYLPDDWQGVYDSVKSAGYAGLSGRADQVYNDNKIYDTCVNHTDEKSRISCEAQAVKGAQDKAFALDAYDKAKERLGQIDALMQEINRTQDPKSIAELQGRIAAEQALIQNEQTKLQMYSMVASAEDRLQQQRQREINAKVLANREYTKHQPFNLLNE
ncbi:P-type DNA transfer protein VirB5 [Alcaligenes faecalis]|uniref:P-type DNA transfer protein VirB5 n=1 Tax=Alcaligenes faecalis TaxID=511 RepID=UPI000A2ECE91|nr:P-type DNA transfer protein VirB5 [Alcaligenes faecalis]MBW4788836.1 P-type DNA transfer protein VirB5 [Alcaligenes faecalis subsp. faecalis]OSZ43552.1 P-type DNA transfer protein VirB5 [Alcaligenes faecalis]OSZ51540.1 P-type DNA transfer protein VirB5 [Alcaligenes faecalis]OSZ55041.1 P-type DNA transfer protein VirB5 [Alcaligenes faecalis]